jgi:DNA repair protein RAD16
MSKSHDVHDVTPYGHLALIAILATRTASQVLKGKYVAESDSEEEAQKASVADSDDEDFKEDDAMSVLSEVEVRSSPTPPNIKFEEAKEDEEEDLYGESVSTSPARPAAKRRRLTKASATPVSVKSAASAVFSPADSLDTPATSVSGSVRKIGSAIRGTKRKLLEEVAALSGDSDEESEFELSLESDAAEDEAEDETLSLAPTVSSEEQLVEAVSNANRRRQAPPQRRGKNTAPRLSQWEKTNLALINFHPELACIWDELETAPTIQPVAVPQPDGLSLQLLPFQLEGLDWLLKQEQQERFSGGILADEMGMGKTIQTIALLLAEPRGKPNLVIAPTVALMQWKQEIETHTNNGLSVCLYYGQNRSVTAKELMDYDVVLTTCI